MLRVETGFGEAAPEIVILPAMANISVAAYLLPSCLGKMPASQRLEARGVVVWLWRLMPKCAFSSRLRPQ
jgi:hypothetical protein